MERRRSQSPPPRTLFSSLPYDLALIILARVPKSYHPILYLVSKSFQSILSSRELYATRSRIGATEACHYVCLNLNKEKPDPRWFIICPLPNQQKLIPIPRFPFPHHPIASTVLAVGSEIYMIGGFLHRDRSKRVFLLDCQSHRWRRLPDMHVLRRLPAAASDVIDGKICVIGGNYRRDVYWGEVYDPKTQTWEPLLSEKEVDLTVPKSKGSGGLLMDGKLYSESGGKCYTRRWRYCFLEMENIRWCGIHHGKLCFGNSEILGLEELSSNQLFAVVNSAVAGRVTVWWKTVKGLPYTNSCKTKIWCAEISFEKHSSQEIWGTVEWSNNVFTFDGSNANSEFFLQTAIVTL